ncbi:MAG: hypothetical protein ACUVXI_03410 [bacterium]
MPTRYIFVAERTLTDEEKGDIAREYPWGKLKGRILRLKPSDSAVFSDDLLIRHFGLKLSESDGLFNCDLLFDYDEDLLSGLRSLELRSEVEYFVQARVVRQKIILELYFYIDERKFRSHFGEGDILSKLRTLFLHIKKDISRGVYDSLKIMRAKYGRGVREPIGGEIYETLWEILRESPLQRIGRSGEG